MVYQNAVPPTVTGAYYTEIGLLKIFLDHISEQQAGYCTMIMPDNNGNGIAH